MKESKPDIKIIGKLVARVMADGDLDRFSAANFVATLFLDCSAIEALYCYNKLSPEDKNETY